MNLLECALCTALSPDVPLQLSAVLKFDASLNTTFFPDTPLQIQLKSIDLFKKDFHLASECINFPFTSSILTTIRSLCCDEPECTGEPPDIPNGAYISICSNIAGDFCPVDCLYPPLKDHHDTQCIGSVIGSEPHWSAGSCPEEPDTKTQCTGPPPSLEFGQITDPNACIGLHVGDNSCDVTCDAGSLKSSTLFCNEGDTVASWAIAPDPPCLGYFKTTEPTYEPIYGQYDLDSCLNMYYCPITCKYPNHFFHLSYFYVYCADDNGDGIYEWRSNAHLQCPPYCKGSQSYVPTFGAYIHSYPDSNSPWEITCDIGGGIATINCINDGKGDAHWEDACPPSCESITSCEECFSFSHLSL